MSFAILCLIFTLIFIYFYWKQKSKSSLPGPWGLPLLGHVLFLGKNPAVTFLKWKQKYGPVFELNFAGKRSIITMVMALFVGEQKIEANVFYAMLPLETTRKMYTRDYSITGVMLVLNDRKSIVECFSKQEFAGRTALKLLDIISQSAGPGLGLNTGSEVEELRQFFFRSFKEHGLQRHQMEEHFQEETEILLDGWRSMTKSEFELTGVFGQLVLNCVWRVIATNRYNAQEAKLIIGYLETVVSAESVMAKLSFIVPGIVSKISSAVHTKIHAMLSINDMLQGNVNKVDRVRDEPRDVVDSFLNMIDNTIDPTSVFHPTKNSFGPVFRDIIAGTVETSSHTLEWFVLYGLKFPSFITKMQEEIDVVVGAHRKPVLADKENMPYTMACIMEIIRIAHVLPLAVPHAALADADFRGHFISKGTIIIGNLHAVHHDPEIWEDPEEFKPERFLTTTGQLQPAVWNTMLPFSTGKRSCLGYSFIMDELFIIVASIYHEFHIISPLPPTSLAGNLGLTYRPQSRMQISLLPRH